MIEANTGYGANDVLPCPACSGGRMRVGRRTPDFSGNPAHEVQSLRCSACGHEASRIVDRKGETGQRAAG